MKNSHCSYCGAAFADLTWPRHCSSCKKTTYRNPLPVGVALVPVDDGVLAIRRGIQPFIGKLALPGGYIESQETWQNAVSREIFEETGLTVPDDELADFCVLSGDDDTLLIFATATPRSRDWLAQCQLTAEVQEVCIVRDPGELVFPLHRTAAERFFAKHR